MNAKICIISGFIIMFILFMLIISTACGIKDMRSEKLLNNYSKLIEKNDLTLTIYYINPFILTRYPLSVDNLINFEGVKKIVVSGSSLEEHMDLFGQINKDDLVPVKNKSRLDARFYYIIETVSEGKILDVCMWGNDNSIFVNGLEVKWNDIFYNVVIPFLPEEAVEEFDLSK